MREYKDEKENSQRRQRKVKINWKDKQAWIGLASACVAVVVAVLLIIGVAGSSQPSIDTGNVGNSAPGDNQQQQQPQPQPPEDTNQPVDEELEMQMPIEVVSVSNEFGFYYNQTLDCYYHHEGVDFQTEAGTPVLAVKSGVVESIYSGDVLKGTEIVLDHGNGLKTVYRFVNAVEGIAVGDKVEQGDMIAVVAEATGDEYKDGAHLHFEILENGKTVDPTAHLEFLEK